MTGGRSWAVLPTIVFAQFAGTSLWFAPNAVVSQIEHFGDSELAWLTSLVQVGFIIGTLSLTYFAATDRYSAPLIFTVMAIAGSLLNALCITTTDFAAWAVLRSAVGFCLAGVYPVGMKIAAKEYPSGLGARLGVLVGALTLGTAFPWLIRGLGDGSSSLPFSTTLAVVSVLAVIGAVLLAIVIGPRQGGVLLAPCAGSADNKVPPPRQRQSVNDTKMEEGQVVDDASSNGIVDEVKQVAMRASDDDSTSQGVGTTAEESAVEHESSPPPPTGRAMLRTIASDSRFRASAIGYWGHMGELYSFWAFVPLLIASHERIVGRLVLGNVALTSFATIAVGALSCALTGLWSLSAGRGVHPGSAVVATASLMLSLLCCLVAPAYRYMSAEVFLVYLLVWGSAVIADSGQFSSLSANFAPRGLVGTALTLTTSIGFLITVISIQIQSALINAGWDPGDALALLAIGPIVGVSRSYYQWPLHQLLPCWRSNGVSNVNTSAHAQSASAAQEASAVENKSRGEALDNQPLTRV
jgi:MFS family permease